MLIANALPVTELLDIGNHKVLVVGRVTASSALAKLGDPASKTRARVLLDETLHLVQCAREGHITQILLGPEILMRRLKVAHDKADRFAVSRRVIAYERGTYAFRKQVIYGGDPSS